MIWNLSGCQLISSHSRPYSYQEKKSFAIPNLTVMKCTRYKLLSNMKNLFDEKPYLILFKFRLKKNLFSSQYCYNG